MQLFGKFKASCLSTSAGSGTRKPENPNFEVETRQTQTRKLLKKWNPINPNPNFAKKKANLIKPEPEMDPKIWYSSNPIEPEPELQTRGYPIAKKYVKNVHFYSQIVRIMIRISLACNGSNIFANLGKLGLDFWP